MSIEGVTVRQADALRAIAAHIDTHGVSPSYDELQRALSLHGKSSINRLVGGLQQRGLIERQGRLARSIVVTALGRARMGAAAPAAGGFGALPVELQVKLAAHCNDSGDSPEHVIADAVRLHLDSFDLVEEAA